MSSSAMTTAQAQALFSGISAALAVDPEATKQSDLDDAQYQMKIREIENQISSLEDKMDELTDNIDKQIDDPNAYKDPWIYSCK